MLRLLKLVTVFLLLGRILCQDKPCPKDGIYANIEADDNTFYCMATVNNEPNPYTKCCWEDRPVNAAGDYDPNGDTYSCCKEDAEASAELWKEFILICVYVGIVTACLMTIVFVTTYCQVDTFPFLKPALKKLRFWKNIILDSICFCPCLPKKFRRKQKKAKPHQPPPEIKIIPDEQEVTNTPVQVLGEGYVGDDFW
ncbi:uncharacterized protein [Antedon mediterranea]|uniref:uncharacterized protein n=1 Tax=Antedon mediterranea TaxID=105859 RepID=UPI003AF662DA